MFSIEFMTIFFQIELFEKARQCIESNYYRNTAKFIFIGTQQMTEQDFQQVSFLFAFLRIDNVVMLNQVDDQLLIKTFNPYWNIEQLPLEYITNVDYVYPDKLIDLNGYTYKALAYPQLPRFYKSNGEYFGIDIKFMETVAKKQNAHFQSN